LIRSAISKLVEGRDLDRCETEAVMTQIMSGEATEAQIASFITALRMKGETVDEITGLARVMRDKAARVISRKYSDRLVDTCGTGGDGTRTFNVSTAAAIVVSAAGVPVAKHGNRSVSSHCGSADVLEALGVKIDLTAQQVGECIDNVGIGFLYAPVLHKAMKYAIGPRRQIGIRTVFNILGPLTNPAGARSQLLGVFDPQLTDPLARVLMQLGSTHVMVVHGADGLDEISTTGETRISELKDGKVETYTVYPEDFGLRRAVLADLIGGDVEDNVRHIVKVLQGEGGPQKDIVVLNAAAALVTADKVLDLMEGIFLAEEAIASGKAYSKLQELKEFTNKYAES